MSQTRLPTPPPHAGPSMHQGSSTLESLIGEITSAKDPAALNQRLRDFGSKETRETIFASMLPGGMDPLTVLDDAENTLGCLYILSARVTLPSISAVSLDNIIDFCTRFNPVHARLAPERVTMLAKGIVKLAESANSSRAVIHPLYHLLTRYCPNLSYLTTIHPIFVRLCVSTRHFTAALPILSCPITEISTSLSDLHYNDHLVYHYAGGMALAALKKWKEAEDFFEAVVCAPAQVPAGIQMEALKKLILVQLIAYGKTKPLVKFTNSVLVRLFRSTPYAAFIKAYPSQTVELAAIIQKEHDLFKMDRNLGLLKQALEKAPRWSIKKLTETYLTLSLTDIGRKVGIADVETVGSMLLGMIDCNEIQAMISADGTVTFDDTDPASKYTQSEIEAVLRAAQDQNSLLLELDRQIGMSKEYLGKALKNKDDSGWGPDEDVLSRGERQEGTFADEPMF